MEAKNRKDFGDLVVAFKRVMNISRGHDVRSVDPALFTDEVEESLYETLLALADRLDTLLRRREYRQVLAELTQLKDPVDRFFDRVLVMDEDTGIRSNRLALLGRVADLFAGVADFSKLVTD
jgi:glycyl-tRNA synthetase beta chain